MTTTPRRGSRGLGAITDVEHRRETAVRTLDCPVCSARPGRACIYGASYGPVAHTGRYNAAAALDLVPPLRAAVANA